jgi:hypothetical protein
MSMDATDEDLDAAAPEAVSVLVPSIITFIAVAMVYLIWRGRSR